MKLSFTSRKQLEAMPLPIDVVLASQSIGRKTLLEKLGIRFRTVVAHVDEEAITDSDPLKMIQKRAAAKVTEVVGNPRVYMIHDDRETLVIAADSMAVLGKKTFGKAQNTEDARAILKNLMGKTHTFVTACHMALLDQGKFKKEWKKVVKTKVTMRSITSLELDAYLARYNFTRFAAAYALNETPWDLVTKVDGSYTNVIGLPFEALLPVLRSLKIIV